MLTYYHTLSEKPRRIPIRTYARGHFLSAVPNLLQPITCQVDKLYMPKAQAEEAESQTRNEAKRGFT